MIERLTHDSFAPCVGDPFRIAPDGDGPPLELELVEIRTFEATDVARRTTGFALEFRGPREPALAQGIRHLEHETLGSLDIFLVPVGPDERGLRYEAIFN